MKKIKLLVMAAIVLAAGVFFLTNENLVKADVTKDTVIENGVYIGGLDVSGMTAEEATQAVDTYVAGLQEQWITLVGPKGSLKYQLKDLGLSAQTTAAVQEATGIGNAGSLIKRYKALQDLEKENYVVDMGLAIDKQLTANNIYNKRSKIDIKAIDNGLKRENGNFVYVPGQEGNEVDIVTAVNELNSHIGTDWELKPVENSEFTLTSIISYPRGTEEQLSVVKDLIGSYSTDYGFSSWERGRNVENGTSKMNGAILYPGDEFSVYEYANPFTKENGYELAGAFLNGDTVQSLGGGICQVVTTLYQAALDAELEITQRFNHSMTVGYVPLGGDAAISGTYKDLRFVNNYDFPVYIESYCKNKNIVINIYGVETRDKNRKVTYESETVSESNPDTEFTLSADHAVGSFIETRAEHIGYVIKYWKVVKVNGVETEKTLVNKSTYRSSCRKVTIGIAGATAEQLAAINAALATNDDAYIESVVVGLTTPTVTTPVETPVQIPDAGTTTPAPEPTPEQPESSQKPENSEKPETSEKPESSEKPGNSEKPESSEKPGNSETPGSSETPGNSEAPDASEKPENSEKPEGSENSESDDDNQEPSEGSN